MKQLPEPGAHVVWPAAPATMQLQPASSKRTTYPQPPAKGLGRLRAAPGAEALRQGTLAQQLAARGKALAAGQAGQQPVTKGCRVRDAAGNTGKVLVCDVLVRGLPGTAAPLWGHVVKWDGDGCEWVDRAALTVRA